MPYIITVLISMALITCINALIPCGSVYISFGIAALWTVIMTVSVIVVDGIFAFLIRRMPCKWFDYKKKFFRVSIFERKLYKALNVKSWHKFVLELGIFTNFSKSQFSSPSDPGYTARFLLESCYGIIIHIACVIVGFLILLINTSFSLRIGLPVALVNAILNILPIFLLRNNISKISFIHERNLRKSNKQKESE